MTTDLLGFVNNVTIAGISLLGTLGAMWLRNHLQTARANRHSPFDEMQMQLDEANEVQSMLQELRKSVDCDRLNVFQFHNGEKFIGTGDSFKRLSNTYEVCAPGISSEVQVVQSLPISLYSSVIKYLSTNNYLYAESVTNSPPLASHVSMLQQRGVKSVYKVPVRNIQGQMIAYLSAEWVRGKHEFSNFEIAMLQKAASLISGYLHTTYKAS